MNSTKTSSADKRYSARPFFTYTLKNDRQHFALYLIIMLLATVLPCIMTMNGYINGSTTHSIEYIIKNTVCESGLLCILSSLVIAVFSGMSAVSYTNSAKMVGCYHSFPIRREGLFLVETSVHAVYYLVALVVSSAAVFCVMSCSLPMTLSADLKYLQYVFAAMLCYMLVYSVLLFAGGLTGTAPVRIIMALLILYLPIAVYGLLVAGAYIGIQELDTEYYLSNKVLRVVCSTYRYAEAIASLEERSYTFYTNILLCIPETALFYVGAFLLHKYRKSESSGATVIWKPIFLLTKYMTVFTAALLGIVGFGGGWFISTNGINTAWIVFGMVFGLVLSFMLINAILYRSSKAIFKDIRGLILTSVVALIVMLVLPLDTFELSEKLYSAEDTKTLRIDDIVYNDSDDIARLVPMLLSENGSNTERTIADRIVLWGSTDVDELNKEFGYIIYDSAEEAESDTASRDARYDLGYNSFSYVDIVQTPRFGIPLAKRVYTDKNDILWDTISRTEEYTEWQERVASVDAEDISGLHIQLGEFDEYVDMSEYLNVIDSGQAIAYPTREYASYDVETIRNMLAELIPNMRYDNTKRDDGVIVGAIQIDVWYDTASARELQNTSFMYPVYSDDITALNGVCRMIDTLYENVTDYEPYPEFTSGEEYMSTYLNEYIRTVAIIDSETGEIRRLPVELFKETASRLVALQSNGYYKLENYVRAYSGRYWVVASFGTKLSSRDPSEDYPVTRAVYYRASSMTDAELERLFDRAG